MMPEEKLRQEIRTDNRQFAMVFLIAAATAFAAGVAVGRFVIF